MNYVLASEIEPGWEVWRESEWVQVEMVIETETPDGRKRRWFYSVGYPAISAFETEKLRARRARAKES